MAHEPEGRRFESQRLPGCFFFLGTGVWIGTLQRRVERGNALPRFVPSFG